MSMKLCCCLCCTSCINEYKLLQNDSGECNELYRITVKYFDPMLFTENNNTACPKEGGVLCQNCWVHIQDFHDFQQAVIKTRTSLQQINIQNSSAQIKVEEDQVSTVFVDDSSYTGSEEVVQLNKVLLKIDFESENYLEEDFETLNNEGEHNKETLKKLKEGESFAKSRKRNDSKINKQTKNIDTSEKRKSKISSKESKERSSNDGVENLPRKLKKPKDSIEEASAHPALDKGREYDKFIAEWKSELECDICGEAFPVFDLLKDHFKDKHSSRAFVKCCDRKFERRCSLVEHIRLHINPEMHKCDICGKISGSKYSLIYHKRTIHEESQKFKCNECPKIFKQKQNLKSHLLTHITGNKDFKCNECDKAYVLEFQLKKHIKLVHIDNRICDQCGKTLHGIGALKNHLKEHSGIEKPKYPCDECGAELGSRITLKRHKASYHNDGSTVYVCSLCGKVSSTERALKNHKKYVHEIERKYKCPHCGKGFKRSQNLQEHIATHTGEALYQCPQCPRSFKINSKYHEHRKKSHPIEWEEGRKNRLEKQKIDYERVTNQVVI